MVSIRLFLAAALLVSVAGWSGTARAYYDVSLSGFVLDAQTKYGIPYAQVVFESSWAPEQYQSVYADAAGRYIVGPLVSGGTYHVVMGVGSSYTPFEAHWTIPADWYGGVGIANIELQPPSQQPIQQPVPYPTLTREQLPDMSPYYHQADDHQVQQVAGGVGGLARWAPFPAAQQFGKILRSLAKVQGCATKAGIINYRGYWHRNDSWSAGVYIVSSRYQRSKLTSWEGIWETLPSCLGVTGGGPGSVTGGGPDDLQLCTGGGPYSTPSDTYDVFWVGTSQQVCNDFYYSYYYRTTGIP